MTEDALQQAIYLVRTGVKIGASDILNRIIEEEPENEAAWLWLAVCMDSTEEKQDCLNKVLEINPENHRAKQALKRLQNLELSAVPQEPNGEPVVEADFTPTSEAEPQPDLIIDSQEPAQAEADFEVEEEPEDDDEYEDEDELIDEDEDEDELVDEDEDEDETLLQPVDEQPQEDLDTEASWAYTSETLNNEPESLHVDPWQTNDIASSTQETVRAVRDQSQNELDEDPAQEDFEQASMTEEEEYEEASPRPRRSSPFSIKNILITLLIIILVANQVWLTLKVNKLESTLAANQTTTGEYQANLITLQGIITELAVRVGVLENR